MPDVSLEQRLALITVAFLTAYRPRVTPPLAPDLVDPPDPEVVYLPLRTSFQEGERPLPCAVVDCEAITPHHNRKLLKCPVTVTVEVKHADTSEQDERIWVRQLRKLMRNKTLWREFLAGQEEADRTGYQILKLTLSATAVSIDAETECRYLATTLTLFVHSDELEATT